MGLFTHARGNESGKPRGIFHLHTARCKETRAVNYVNEVTKTMSPSYSGHDCKKEEGLLLLILAGWPMKRRKKRHIWVRETLQKRSDLGEYHKLVRELDSHENRFNQYTYFRMSRGQFAEILTLFQQRITKTTTHWQKPISAAGRLAVCLRCVFVLANGFKLWNLCTFWRHGIKFFASKFHAETKDVSAW